MVSGALLIRTPLGHEPVTIGALHEPNDGPGRRSTSPPNAFDPVIPVLKDELTVPKGDDDW
jgi:hypothetical protein